MADPTLARRNFFDRSRSWLVVAIGFLVFLPGLLSPYWLDDYVQKSMAHGTFPSRRSPFDLYNFVTDGDRTLLIDRGVLPWWTHPHLTIRFFRPLSSALRWLDFRLSDHPLLHHAHSFLWWALAVVGARALYKHWLSPRATAIATAIFALAPCHAIPLSWLANREVLVSLAFGTFALGAFVRYRENGARRDFWAALALFALAMLAGEYSLAFGGYVLALEVFVPSKTLERRAMAIASFAAPALATIVVRAKLGFGNFGSGFYRDPFVQTRAFFEGAPRRLARMLVDAWLASDSDWAMDAKWYALGAFVIFVGVAIAIPVRRALRAHDAATRRLGLGLVAGTMVALAPMVAVLPSPRLLGVAVLGIAPVVALALEHAWFPAAPADAVRGDLASVLAVLLGFFHLVHAPVTSFLSTRFFHETSTDFVDRAAWLRDRVDDKPLEANIVVARAGWQTVLFSPFALAPDGRLPHRWWVLSLVPHALLLRSGEHTIDLVVPKGRGYFPTGPDDLFRSEDQPLHAGDVVHVPGLTAKVIEGGEHGPGRVHFVFEQKIESLVWVTDGKKGWRDATPPRVGFGMPLDP